MTERDVEKEVIVTKHQVLCRVYFRMPIYSVSNPLKRVTLE